MAALHNPASIPLLSLNAIAFDSETTGLDTSQARMIQLGAVRILHGEVDESQSFQSLINPGLPIPPASQAIHGISDADVASAAGFNEVVQAFDDWCQDSVLVGYASGFDLAMLKREKQLAGLEWVAPRCLDVRFLVNLLGPNLPDFSLDTIAAWVGVEIQHRHSALGDAIGFRNYVSAVFARWPKSSALASASAKPAQVRRKSVGSIFSRQETRVQHWHGSTVFLIVIDCAI